MKNDRNGCSTCPAGQERYERYWSANLSKYRFQYDYRDADGQLFSCVAATLEECRRRRDNWLAVKAERARYLKLSKTMGAR